VYRTVVLLLSSPFYCIGCTVPYVRWLSLMTFELVSQRSTVGKTWMEGRCIELLLRRNVPLYTRVDVYSLHFLHSDSQSLSQSSLSFSMLLLCYIMFLLFTHRRNSISSLITRSRIAADTHTQYTSITPHIPSMFVFVHSVTTTIAGCMQ
jgi:hypothetical protein